MTGVRRTAAVAALLSFVGLALGCRAWGPKLELPDDPEEAAQNSAVGSRALLRANQTELELAAWQPAVQSLVDALGDGIDPASAQTVRAAVRRAYGAQRLFDRVATSLSDDWDPEAARAHFAFLDSGVGHSLMRARLLRRDPKTAERFAEWSRGYSLSHFPRARVELLQRLDRALLTSRGAVLVNRALVDGALSALVDNTSGAEAAGFRSLRERAAREESQMYPVVADDLLRWQLFAYESLSDDDLTLYAEFAESPAGQWYVVASARAQRIAANGAGEELFQALRPRGGL